MARRGVAATVASVILLSTLVVAAATVMTGQDNSAQASRQVQLLTRIHLLDVAEGGAASLSSLADVASVVASTPAACEGLKSYPGQVTGSAALNGTDTGIAYTATAAVFPDFATGSPGDNLTAMAPFAGHADGMLNLEDDLQFSATTAGDAITLGRAEVHLLNLPIRVSAAESLCSSVASGLSGAFAPNKCNYTLDAKAYAHEMPLLVASALAQNFTLTAGYSLGCTMTFTFTLVQQGVQGPAGPFDWTVLGKGSVYTGQPVVTKPPPTGGTVFPY